MAEDEWIRDSDLEELFSLFEVEIEAWVTKDFALVNFEDMVSRNFDEMLFQLSYIMVALDFAFEDGDFEFQNTNFQSFIYSLYLPNPTWSGARDDKHDERQYLRYDLFLYRNWLEEYFNASRRERDAMLLEEFRDQRDSWNLPIPSNR